MADFKIAVRFRNGVTALYDCFGALDHKHAREATLAELGEDNVWAVLVAEKAPKHVPILEPAAA